MIAAGDGVWGWCYGGSGAGATGAPEQGALTGLGWAGGVSGKPPQSWKWLSRQTGGTGTQWGNTKGKQEREWRVRIWTQAACRMCWAQTCKRQASSPHVCAVVRLPAPWNSHLLDALLAHSPPCRAHSSRSEPPVLTSAGAPRPHQHRTQFWFRI